MVYVNIPLLLNDFSSRIANTTISVKTTVYYHTCVFIIINGSTSIKLISINSYLIWV